MRVGAVATSGTRMKQMRRREPTRPRAVVAAIVADDEMRDVNQGKRKPLKTRGRKEKRGYTVKKTGQGERESKADKR